MPGELFADVDLDELQEIVDSAEAEARSRTSEPDMNRRRLTRTERVRTIQRIVDEDTALAARLQVPYGGLA